MTEKDLTKKVLVEVAKDLSTIFEQPIKTGNKTTNDEIKKDLISAGNELQKDDEISDKSKEVLTLLGVKLPFEKEKEEEEKEEKASSSGKGRKIGVANPEIGKRNKLIESLIAKGKFTQKEIVEKVLEKFPDHSPGGIATMISDGKNPKYNKFSNIVKANPDSKILSF